MLHQREQILRKGLKTNPGRITYGMSLAVGSRIEREQAKPRRRAEQAEGLADISTQTMLKKEGDALAFGAVVELNCVVGEEGH